MLEPAERSAAGSNNVASGVRNRLLSEEVLIGALAPSVDRSGRWLLFTNSVPRQPAQSALAPGLYLLDMQSGALRQIDGTARPLATLAPDGAWVALTDSDYSELGLLSVDSGERRLLARAPAGGWKIQPPFAFAPDGQTVAYIVERRAPESLCSEYQLWIADVGGGAPRRLRAVDELSPDRVTWSPDGRRLAVSTYACQGSVMRYVPAS